MIQLFHDGDRYHIETSPLICSANQWTGFYMITASVMKELRKSQISTLRSIHLPCFCCYMLKNAVLNISLIL